LESRARRSQAKFLDPPACADSASPYTIEFSFDIFAEAFAESRLRVLLSGGHALKAHGLARFTRGIDLCVAEGDLKAMRACLESLSFRPDV